jgi:hypothetical protein
MKEAIIDPYVRIIVVGSKRREITTGMVVAAKRARVGVRLPSYKDQFGYDDYLDQILGPPDKSEQPPLKKWVEEVREVLERMPE